ncbi:MAG TPA: hypothetical protein VMT09_05345 [Steroidobacteraceae bacterium]|nr:hypothetical protein [Steroidobacteraceae bacterium]
MWSYRAAAIAMLSALTLGSAVGRSDDTSRPAAGQAPAAGFLEFLGSVDRLSEVNPNYLSQPTPVKTARPTASGGTRPPPSPPPAPAQAPTSPGDKNNG